jgi:hypothetical protein
MAKGGYSRSNETSGPAMANRSMPFGRAIPETTLLSFQGWSAHRAGGLWLTSNLLDTPRRMLFAGNESESAAIEKPLPKQYATMDGRRHIAPTYQRRISLGVEGVHCLFILVRYL